jgi:hypothetical protein
VRSSIAYSRAARVSRGGAIGRAGVPRPENIEGAKTMSYKASSSLGALGTRA